MSAVAYAPQCGQKKEKETPKEKAATEKAATEKAATGKAAATDGHASSRARFESSMWRNSF